MRHERGLEAAVGMGCLRYGSRQRRGPRQTLCPRGPAACSRIRASLALRPAVLLLLAAPFLNACYRYVPTPEMGAARGSRIRVNLLQPEQVRLSEVIVSDAVTIAGEIIRVDGRRVALSALAVTSRSGSKRLGKGETVVVVRNNIRSLEEKQISILRTAGLAGAMLLLGTLAGLAMQDAGGGTIERPGGGQTK